MKKKRFFYALSGLLLILVVLVFIATTPPQKQIIDWIALSFLSLGVLLVSILLIELGGTAFSNLALGSVGGIYLIINLVMALFAKIIFEKEPLRYVLIQLILLILTGLVIAILIRFANLDAGAAKNAGIMRRRIGQLSNRIARLDWVAEKEEYHMELQQLAEAIELCLPISMEEAEEIERSVAALEKIVPTNDEYAIKQSIAHLAFLTQRSSK